jgi:enterochelin esterase family protein
MARFLVLLTWLLACAPAWAAGTVETRRDQASAVLGRPIPYQLYRPETVPEGKRLAVLYLLHGVGEDESAWFGQGKMAGLLDAGIRSGWLPPLVAVAPGVGKSWYVDNPDFGGAGRMATALRDDFIPGVEAALAAAGLPVARCQRARAIGGNSMGGYGAMLHALDRPELFAAAFSLSGGLFRPRASDVERDSVMGLPFSEEWFHGAFGEKLDAARFDGWTVFRRLDNFLGLPLRPAIWLSAATADYPIPIDGSTRLHLMLQRAGADSTLRVSAGRHDWEHWTSVMPEVLAWLGERLDAGCGG